MRRKLFCQRVCLNPVSWSLSSARGTGSFRCENSRFIYMFENEALSVHIQTPKELFVFQVPFPFSTDQKKTF